MGVSFKHISLQNFCNQKSFDADLSQKTIIAGKNREGKSTIRNAILWVLTDKLSDNSAAGDSIRPHDENGNRIDSVDIIASLTVSVDGAEYVLTKTQKQKWVKQRGSEERTFQGNENLYEISGVPKKAKDYEAFINENICPIDDLPFCINANAFLSLDSKKRRAKVLGLAKCFSDDDVIATNPAFEELRNDLKVGTLEELTKRSKSTITALKKTQQELPSRIDEVSRQRVDYNFSDLELERKALEDQLAEIDRKSAKVADIKEQILKAKFDLSAIEQKLNSDVKDQRHEIEMQIAQLKSNLRTITDDITRFTGEKESAQTFINNNDKAIESARQQMKLAEEKVFDDSDLICPNCKQPYPAEKQGDLRAEFEQRKSDEMDRVSDYIDSLIANKESANDRFAGCEKKIAELKSTKEEFEKEIANLENKAAGLVLVDVTKDSEYIAKLDEITALESKLENTAPIDNKAEIESKIADIERKLAQTDVNNRVDERIAQLKNEQRVVGDNILKQERMLYLLEEYNKAKIGMVEDSVNGFFDIIKWRFFQEQINGGYAEVCKATVSGTDYDGLLNKSDRLLCQTDLVLGFQKAAGVSLPVAIDDTESIDSDRIPALEQQMILFRREDGNLTVRSE